MSLCLKKTCHYVQDYELYVIAKRFYKAKRLKELHGFRKKYVLMSLFPKHVLLSLCRKKHVIMSERNVSRETISL